MAQFPGRLALTQGSVKGFSTKPDAGAWVTYKMYADSQLSWYRVNEALPQFAEAVEKVMIASIRS